MMWIFDYFFKFCAKQNYCIFTTSNSCAVSMLKKEESDSFKILPRVEPLYIANTLYSGRTPYNGHFFRERIDQKPHRKSLLS